MVKTLKQHLIDTFDDMTQENVKKFTESCVRGLKNLASAELTIEKIKDSLDLADLMVDTFTSIGAVTVTIELLRAINCNEQAVSLSEATGQTGDPGSANVTPVNPSAPSNGQQFMDKHQIELIGRVKNVDAILDELLVKKIITNEGYEKIRSKSTPTEKMRDLIFGPMVSAGNVGRLALYEALKKSDPALMIDLGAP